MKIGIAGAGAFGTAMAITLANAGKPVTLWARDADAVSHMQKKRESIRLPDMPLPDLITPTGDIDTLLANDIILLAVPAQTLRPFLTEHTAALTGKHLVACCKGIDVETLEGPVSSIQATVPKANAAMLTGPSFAFDIAKGLPTALTLAAVKDGELLQSELATNALRLYSTKDTIGAELGGALKNVIAIGAGVTIGGGLGESARAALITRGFNEMQRLSAKLGADPQTLVGLSGFGDLTLTCNSTQSRNFTFGLSIGQGNAPDLTKTVEGAATALAVRKLAKSLDLDLPVCSVVAALSAGETTVDVALKSLLARPLKEE